MKERIGQQIFRYHTTHILNELFFLGVTKRHLRYWNLRNYIGALPKTLLLKLLKNLESSYSRPI